MSLLTTLSPSGRGAVMCWRNPSGRRWSVREKLAIVAESFAPGAVRYRACQRSGRCQGAGRGAARREDGVMIVPPTGVRVLVATKPVDFRKGMAVGRSVETSTRTDEEHHPLASEAVRPRPNSTSPPDGLFYDLERCNRGARLTGGAHRGPLGTGARVSPTPELVCRANSFSISWPINCGQRFVVRHGPHNQFGVAPPRH